MPAKFICVTGLVQGVFFRDRAKANADELGIAGWVKNCDDGSVEIHAEGSGDALQTLEEWCHRGPPSAEVDSVRVEETKEEGSQTFEILW
ncbi:MAG: acylphosphatase [Candidatus Peribacteraceae bacterium]|jgi:acylphosphatase